MFRLGRRAQLREIIERLATIEAALGMLAARIPDETSLTEVPVDEPGPMVIRPVVRSSLQPRNEAVPRIVEPVTPLVSDITNVQPGISQPVDAYPPETLHRFANELRGLHRELEQARLKVAA
jgi:hypothetical protein